MRFTFVDRIIELQPGAKITTLKCLSMAEEYLADHFPKFAVMPGVLMIEAMAEAGAWLLRATDDFAHSIITLKEARNVLFADFVQPGRVLTVTAEIHQQGEREVQFKTQGMVGDNVAVRGRLTLERYNLADSRPEQSATDDYLKQSFRAQFGMLYQPPGDVSSIDPAVMIAARDSVAPGRSNS
jgi:3-hydroxyacyl-[acyl-carrier-protein] dehydratase